MSSHWPHSLDVGAIPPLFCFFIPNLHCRRSVSSLQLARCIGSLLLLLLLLLLLSWRGCPHRNHIMPTDRRAKC
jgi:hypothetical protein